MNVKGTALTAVKDFIETTFGADGLARWLAALPPASREIMEGRLMSNQWYPFVDGLIVPEQQLCKLFFDGSPRGAWEEARYKAEVALKGIYRSFIRVATPEFLLRNAHIILEAYFTGVEVKILENTKGRFLLRFYKVDPPSEVFDHILCGWIERAMEICGCQNLRVAALQPGTITREFTEILVTWG
ncbi:MAG: hypothetical protein QME74_08485 [Candidatus Edwardsbacteria bacterium]|nr:hypothetical protein [Candidatus Edwardsbacteria bacterium]